MLFVPFLLNPLDAHTSDGVAEVGLAGFAMSTNLENIHGARRQPAD